jgi:hypothetical protein
MHLQSGSGTQQFNGAFDKGWLQMIFNKRLLPTEHFQGWHHVALFDSQV